MRNRRRVVYYTILLLLILGELLGERNYIIIIFPEYNIDKKRAEVKEYKVGDLVMLSTKDLKYQMVRRRIEKLIEKFVGPYKVKKIVSTNVVELELPSTIKIYPVVNISRIHRYVGQVEGQKRE